MWLRGRNGFNYSETFNNFLNQGGWDSLSPDEQQTFLEAYKKIPSHDSTDRIDRSKSDEEVCKDEIHKIARQLVDMPGGFEEEYQKMSLRDFMDHVQKELLSQEDEY